MDIASFLGALALAASIYFLYYQYWGLLTAAAQVTLLVTASVGSFAGTVWLQRRDTTGYFNKLAALVAFVCFVLNIAMLGQIFNVTPSDRALAPWAAFAFLLAYTADLRLLLVAGMVCVVMFLASRTGALSGALWSEFSHRPENFFPAAIALWLVPRLVDHRRFSGFASTFRVCALLTLFFPVLILANSAEMSYLEMDPDLVKPLYQMLGFAGSAAAVWFGIRRHWPEVVTTGVVIFVVFLGNKFFDWWWDTMPKYLFFLVLGLTALLFLNVLNRLRVLGSGAKEGTAP